MLINLNKNLKSEVKLLPIQTLYSLHNDESKKLYSDDKRLQRILKQWPDYKTFSYLKCLVNGGNYKDLIQLAEIKSIVFYLKDRLKNPSKNDNIQVINENLEYFLELQEKGYEYLILDGQHRLNAIKRFIDGNFDIRKNQSIVFKDEERNIKIYVEGTFKDQPDIIKDHFLNIPVIVTIYNVGDLKELVNIFITSNDMVHMTNHEKRILNYNPLNKNIVDYCYVAANLKKTLSTINGMKGEYCLDNKGDTLAFAMMLMYLDDNTYEDDEKVLNDLLGPNPSRNIKSETFDLCTDIWKVVSDGCISLKESHLKKFSISSIFNFFYTISFLMQKGNYWAHKAGFENTYKIKDPAAFAKWFFDMEYERINAPGTYITFESKDNKTKKQKRQKHEYSFKAHLADQKHKKKQSTKGEGGSIYTFDEYARILYILNDLKKKLHKLEAGGIISKVGSRSGSRDPYIVASGIPLSESDNYHVHEITPVSKGGIRTLEGAVAIPKKINAHLKDRPSAFKPASELIKKKVNG